MGESFALVKPAEYQCHFDGQFDEVNEADSEAAAATGILLNLVSARSIADNVITEPVS
jgi:hypothetical protein